MEAYRKKLRIQNGFSLLGILLLAVLVILSLTEVIRPIGGGSRWIDFWNGFIGGGTAAFAAILLLNIILNLRAMRSPEALKKQYIKTHDERRMQIWYQSGANAYWFDTIGLLLAAIVVGYFLPTASICIVACLLYICVVRVVLKVYYSKKI